MTEITASIDTVGMNNLQAILTRIALETPERLATETRHALILLCRSLKARTKKAPKKIRSKEYAAEISSVPPKYIHSNSAGHRLLRRWTLARKLGTPDAYARHYYVYTDRHRRNGRMAGGSTAAEKRELLRQHGGIPRAGLAKKSWGWIAKKLYNSGEFSDLAYTPRRGEKRDPRREVDGKFVRTRQGAGGYLHNKLDYIADAMITGGVDEAIRAASSALYRSVWGALEDAEQRPASSARGGNWWTAYARAQGRI